MYISDNLNFRESEIQWYHQATMTATTAPNTTDCGLPGLKAAAFAVVASAQHAVVGRIQFAGVISKRAIQTKSVERLQVPRQVGLFLGLLFLRYLRCAFAVLVLRALCVAFPFLLRTTSALYPPTGGGRVFPRRSSLFLSLYLQVGV